MGGARPKASIAGEFGNLSTAKFPSQGDSMDKVAWKYLPYKLVLECGIEMSESRKEKVAGSITHSLPGGLSGLEVIRPILPLQ